MKCQIVPMVYRIALYLLYFRHHIPVHAHTVCVDALSEVTKESIMQFLGQEMPPSMYDVISSTVLDIVSNQRGGLLSLGFLFSIYLSTNGTMALMRAFNACYRTAERRSAVRTRLIATGLTFNFALVLFLAIILLVVGQLVLEYVLVNLENFGLPNVDGFTVFLILTLRFLVIFIVFFFAISMLYYFGPAIHYNWRFFSIGSFIATLLCMAVSCLVLVLRNQFCHLQQSIRRYRRLSRLWSGSSYYHGAAYRLRDQRRRSRCHTPAKPVERPPSPRAEMLKGDA